MDGEKGLIQAIFFFLQPGKQTEHKSAEDHKKRRKHLSNKFE